MQVPLSTTHNLPSGKNILTKNGTSPTQYSLRLDIATQNRIILDAVYERQFNLNENDISNLISELKAMATSSQERIQLAEHQKYLEGISIAKEKYNIFGEAAHEFASGYSQFYFCERNPIGNLIIQEIASE